MSSEIGVADIKRRFSEFLSRVELNRERVLIRRRGQSVAALVPADEIKEDCEPGNDARRKGILAAAGVWVDFDDTETFNKHVRRLRDKSTDRKIKPFE